MYTTDPISLPNLSKRLNEMYADPGRDAIAFWRLVESYIGKIANNRGISQDDLNDLVQDCLVQAWRGIGKIKVDPRHSGTNSGYSDSKINSSFTRWLSGLVARRIANMHCEKARAKEIPISQLGTWTDDDEFEATELEDLPNSPVVMQPHDDPDSDEERWSRADKVDAALAAVRALLDGDDAVMFDLLRDGSTTYGVGKAFGIEEKAVRRRITVWKGLVKRHGIEGAL